jgi:hypothetical protein
MNRNMLAGTDIPGTVLGYPTAFAGCSTGCIY